MKKLLCFLMAAVMLLSLAACGGKGPIEEDPATNPGAVPAVTAGPGGTENPANTDKPVNPDNPGTPTADGDYYDTGLFKALVPEGWKAFPQTDVFSDEEGALDATSLSICKGGETDWDLFTKPYVQIKYNGPDGTLMEPDKDWYDDVTDLAPFSTGAHNWTAFSGESFGTKLMILFEDLGDIQFQVTLYYETDSDKYELDDADVQAILASIEITDPEAQGASGEKPTAAPTEGPGGGEEGESAFAWWAGDWYGWWVIIEGDGIYEDEGEQGACWDAYAHIELTEADAGTVTLWYSGNYKSEPLIEAKVHFNEDSDERGVMVLDSGTMFPAGNWDLRRVDVNSMEIGYAEWYVDPADSTVSHFENMIEISGSYVDPENEGDAFEYRVYLRPWGTRWEDVENGDTSGCVYSDMMPLHYDDWYLPLLELGYQAPPDDYYAGADLIENQEPAEPGAPNLDPEGRFNASGEVDMATLQRCLPWCRNETGYKTTYEEVAAQFGVHGKRELSEFYDDVVYYRWWCGDAYIQIAFNINADGSETWNNTQWDGID